MLDVSITPCRSYAPAEVRAALERRGAVIGRDVALDVAPRAGCGKRYTV